MNLIGKHKSDFLSLINYRSFCDVQDFTAYESGHSLKDTLYLVQQQETLPLIQPDVHGMEKQFPKVCTTNEFYIASINHAVCLKHQPIVANKHFLLPDSFRFYRYMARHKALLYHANSNRFETKEKRTNVEKIPGETIFLSGELSDSYGHFLLELLSRLWITQVLDIRQYRFIMNPTDKHRWQLDMLQALGIKQKQIIYLHKPVQCERLLIPVQAFVLRNYTSTLAAHTWKKLGDYYDEGNGPERIYVSRSKLQYKRRRLLNEKAVERVFASHGFIITHPQLLNVQQQITLFRNAKIIAGPSGSALYNSVFQKEQTKKLILTTDKFLKVSDVLINTTTNGKLSYFLGKTIENKRPIEADWMIRIEELKAYLQHYL